MRRKTAYLALGAIALAGCNPVSRPTPEETATAREADTLAKPSRPNAVRYLEQATFGPTPATIDHVVAVGISNAITEELNAPVTTYALTYDPLNTNTDLGAQFFLNALSSSNSDKLRQRTAFALSQILVVSQSTVAGNADIGTDAMGRYLNILSAGAFGNYRDLLTNVTVSPIMGKWLSMANNHAFTTAGVAIDPNENYARELLQLFTLGLNLLNDDGTPVLVNGKPTPSYTQDQVEALAHTLTGWTYAGPTCAKGKGNGADYTQPMVPCDLDHDSTPQALFNGFVTTNALGAQAHLTQALDNIFAHQNLPPFVCKQLIQHLVTSNPTPAYVGRVVAKFKDDGTAQHKRGNLAVVIRAILEDTEARGPVPPFAVQSTFGHLRPPALFLTNLLRWTNATVADGVKINSWSNTLGQYVPRPPTVFSYYPPDTPLPGNPTLVGPEFAISDTATTLSRSNFLDSLLFLDTVVGTHANPNTLPANPCAGTSGLAQYKGWYCDAGYEFIITDQISCADALANCQLNSAANPTENLACTWNGQLIGIQEPTEGACTALFPYDPGAVLQWLDDNLMHDTMSAQLKAIVLEAISAPNVPPAKLLPLGIYLVASSSEYQVQR